METHQSDVLKTDCSLTRFFANRFFTYRSPEAFLNNLIASLEPRSWRAVLIFVTSSYALWDISRALLRSGKKALLHRLSLRI